MADIPKCMAPVEGKPFLHYVIAYLQTQGITSFIFALGHLHEQVIDYLEKEYPSLQKQYSIEDTPLGTGGAIKLACSKARGKDVVVVNGDTLFKLDLEKLITFHTLSKADCTLSLKRMAHFNRYGVVELNTDYSIRSFREKKEYKSGIINAGVYALNVERFISEDLPAAFSFEKDYLEKYFEKRKMYAVVQDRYFIDIGIPEDYERAKVELIMDN